MGALAKVLVAAVGLLHVWILILEMFLWKKPQGLRAFRMTRDQAEATAVLAANQGLYNGFLAAGLLTSLAIQPEVAFAFQVFFLGCVVVAGVYGAWTASRKILYIQTLPALLALAAVLGAQAG
jgi:putative membrane protein